MVHSLEVIHKLNREAVEKSNRKYGGGPPVPLRDVSVPPAPKTPNRIEMDYPAGLLRMWRFCDEDAFRYALECVRVDFVNGVLEATDGRIAVRHEFEAPLEWRSFEPALFVGEVLQQVARHEAASSLRRSTKLVRDDGKWYAENGFTRYALEFEVDESLKPSTKWPNMDAVFRPATSDNQQSVTFVLNMKLLSNFTREFKCIENASGEPALKITVPLDGGAFRLQAGRFSGDRVDARLMPMSDENKPTIQINKALIWRKATAEDCGRPARFRERGENGFAYGLLVEVGSGCFKCKFSDNNDIVKHFDLCEVQQ